jgi:uncharacterized Fe-S cluster protein YjdI
MARKTYRGAGLAVSFDAEMCAHAGECVRGAPAVFDVHARPWIQLDKGDAAALREVVAKCPSGALRLEEGETTVSAAVVVKLAANGPLLIDGPCVVVASDGGELKQATKLALCRCGHSSKKPFCDGAHTRMGFQAE